MVNFMQNHSYQNGPFYSTISLADKLFFKAEEDFLRVRRNIVKTDPKRIDHMMEQD